MGPSASATDCDALTSNAVADLALSSPAELRSSRRGSPATRSLLTRNEQLIPNLNPSVAERRPFANRTARPVRFLFGP